MTLMAMVMGKRFGRPYCFETFWTEDKTEKLLALNAEASYSCRDIAEKLGCTRNAVIGRLHRLRVQILTPEVLAGRRNSRPRPRAPKPVTGPMVSEHHDEPADDLPPPAAVEAPEPAHPEGWVRFADLGAFTSIRHCRFPVEGAPGPDMWCCGADRISVDRPYCAAHWKIATNG